MNMQEKITSQREHIDFLQSRIKHLEETMEKLHQVNTLIYQSYVAVAYFLQLLC